MKEKPNNAVGPQVRGIKRTNDKLVPAISLLSMIAGIQTASQYFAYCFNYQPQLGFNISHIYLPWSILRWYVNWDNQFHNVFMKAGSIGALVACTGLIIAALIMKI